MLAAGLAGGVAGRSVVGLNVTCRKGNSQFKEAENQRAQVRSDGERWMS